MKKIMVALMFIAVEPASSFCFFNCAKEENQRLGLEALNRLDSQDDLKINNTGKIAAKASWQQVEESKTSQIWNNNSTWVNQKFDTNSVLTTHATFHVFSGVARIQVASIENNQIKAVTSCAGNTMSAMFQGNGCNRPVKISDLKFVPRN